MPGTEAIYLPENKRMTFEKSFVSKERVADHGEVYTPKHVVDAMLDLVKQETERIDSRFLEPACGTGNFLAEILHRKLLVVSQRYRRSQLEYERNAVLAVSSLYGIDILADNVQQCRERLCAIFDEVYTGLYKKKARAECREAARFILKHNIIHGNALTLMTAGDDPKPIVFSEWALVNGSKFKRRDFAFVDLTAPEAGDDATLFDVRRTVTKQDIGGEGFIPEPVKSDYPPTNFWELPRVDE